MRPILAFDTSAAHCAAAVYWQSDNYASVIHSEAMAKGQAERLLPMIEEMLASSGLTWADIGALGVGTGPGNFTGIRIAVALARGLSLGLNIPAIGVTGFDARAFGEAGDFYVTIPAPRGQIYAQRFGQHRPAALIDSAPDDGRLVPLDTLPPADLALAIARVTATRLSQDCPRPAPFYLRAADAAPPSDPPPVILP